MARILTKKTAVKRWKNEMKDFTSYAHRNEDFLYIHNHYNKYMVGENKEFLNQLQLFKDAGLNLKLYKKNIKNFTYKNKKYIMITINGEDCEGTDGDAMSEMAFAFGVIVGGFTYLFKYHSFQEIESEIKSNLNYIK